MEEQRDVREKMEKELSSCETRLGELMGKAKDDKLAKELGQIEKELKSCRLELNELEGKSDDQWLEAKHGITRRLEDVQRNLQLSARRVEDFIR